MGSNPARLWTNWLNEGLEKPSRKCLIFSVQNPFPRIEHKVLFCYFSKGWREGSRGLGQRGGSGGRTHKTRC